MALSVERVEARLLHQRGCKRSPNPMLWWEGSVLDTADLRDASALLATLRGR